MLLLDLVVRFGLRENRMRDTQTPAALDEWRGFFSATNAGLSATLFHSLQETKHAVPRSNKSEDGCWPAPIAISRRQKMYFTGPSRFQST
jgi:hypothetical protein